MWVEEIKAIKHELQLTESVNKAMVWGYVPEQFLMPVQSERATSLECLENTVIAQHKAEKDAMIRSC